MSVSQNLEVIVGPDCGNAPRKAQVRDWLIAMASGNVDEVCALLSDEVIWEIAGEVTLSGIESVRSRCQELADRRIQTLRLRHLISHGREFAVEGALTVGGEEESFVHVLTFNGHGKNARIARVRTYTA